LLFHRSSRVYDCGAADKDGSFKRIDFHHVIRGSAWPI
jgi:hypothetical protein